MIEQLAQLIKNAGGQAIHLAIRPLADNKVTITVNFESCPLPLSPENDQQQRLRNALAEPITMTADTGEMDVFFAEELTNYANSFIKASQTFTQSNASKASNKLNKAMAQENKEKISATKQTNNTKDTSKDLTIEHDSHIIEPEIGSELDENTTDFSL
jgi:L-lactate utilization protein LutC